MDELASPKDLNELLTAVAKIPGLGTTGILAAIVLLLLLVGVWLYVKRIQIKAAQKSNATEAVKAQAQSEPENEAISRVWDRAHMQVEELRANVPAEASPEPRPKEPGGTHL